MAMDTEKAVDWFYVHELTGWWQLSGREIRSISYNISSSFFKILGKETQTEAIFFRYWFIVDISLGWWWGHLSSTFIYISVYLL